MKLSPAEITACRRLIDLALDEDLGSVGYVTSQTFIPSGLQGQAVFVARAAGVLAGLQAAELVVNAVDVTLSFRPLVEDGSTLGRGTRLFQGLRSQLLRLLAACFLRLEDCNAGLAQLLLVFLSARFSRGYVRPRLLQCTLGTITALGEHPLQRLANQVLVDGIQQ